MRRVTADEMRELDRRAREEFGIPELVLMEHAGRAVAEEAGRLYRAAGRLPILALGRWSSRTRGGQAPARTTTEGQDGSVVVFCGTGANGGDGLVAARHLDNWGLPVSVVLMGSPDRMKGSARLNGEILGRMGLPIRVVDSPRAWRQWVARPVRAAVLVDALLGTGFSGPVREPIRSSILWINRRSCPVVSVDLPSGLSADTGLPQDVAVRAQVTVTCGLPKVGLNRGQGRRFSGRVRVADISLPRRIL